MRENNNNNPSEENLFRETSTSKITKKDDNESDSDEDIQNLNKLSPPQQADITPKNANFNNLSKFSSKNNIKTKKKKIKKKNLPITTDELIKKFMLIIGISSILYILCIILSAIIWVNKRSFFGRIFCLLNIFTLGVLILNIISSFLFRKKFNEFSQNSKKKNTEMEILKEGEEYDELLKSNENSFMNLCLYLLLLLLVCYVIFGLSCFVFDSQIKPEVNSYANNNYLWQIVYQDYTYPQIIKYLTVFNILFGILSIFAIIDLSYLFYLLFKILGFFHIYQKIVKFLSMLYLQIGIILLFLSVYFLWFKDLSDLDDKFVRWLPKAILISSIAVIIVSIIAYIGSSNKDVKWLISCVILTTLFVAFFIVFFFITVISAHSIGQFDDMKCPKFINYFNKDYTINNLSCKKYLLIEDSIEKLNCPKERIVTNWEYNMNLTLIDKKKETKYGCINISCCYELYNLIQSYLNYLVLICFFIEIFGLVLLGSCIYLINLIQEGTGYSVDEKTSQYFVYLFVGIISGLFIYLLFKLNLPKFSPSFTSKFSKSKIKENDLDLLIKPLSEINNDNDLLEKMTDLFDKENSKKHVIHENHENCHKNFYECKKLIYKVFVKSDIYPIEINEDRLRLYNFKYEFKDNDKKNLILTGDNSIGKFLYKIISLKSDNICQNLPIYAKVKINAYVVNSENDKINQDQSFIQIKNTNKQENKPFEKNINSEGINEIDIKMDKIKLNEKYTLFDEMVNFGMTDANNTQIIDGYVYYKNFITGKKTPFNDDIYIKFVNFQYCDTLTYQTNKNGYFKTDPFPLFKNNIKNEIYLTFNNNNLKKIINLGGLGAGKYIHLNEIILQTYITKDTTISNDIENYLTFSSYVQDSISNKPIENVTIDLYEGDVYFIDDFDKSNNEYYIRSVHSNNKGYFKFDQNIKLTVFTLVFNKIGYYNTIETIDIIKNERENLKNYLSFSLTPNLKDNYMRIVLNWPNGPYDLNLFSYFKYSDTSQCEVYYGNEKCQNVYINNENYNNGTQGTQTLTIEKLGNYIYTFAINPFYINDNPIDRNEKKVEGVENNAPTEYYPEFNRTYSSEINDITFAQSKANIKIYIKEYKKEIYKMDINSHNTDKDKKWLVAFCLNGNKGIKSLKVINKYVGVQPNYSYCEEIYKSEGEIINDSQSTDDENVNKDEEL